MIYKRLWMIGTLVEVVYVIELSWWKRFFTITRKSSHMSTLDSIVRVTDKKDDPNLILMTDIFVEN